MNLSIGTDGHVLNMLVLDILSDRCVEGVVHNGRLFVLLFHSGALFSGESIDMLFLCKIADRGVEVVGNGMRCWLRISEGFNVLF